MFHNKWILVTLSFVAAVNGQVIRPGRCPGVKVMKKFDVGKYLGTWYEFGRYPLVWEANGKCNTATYTLRDDGNVGVYNTQINQITGKTEDIEGYATVVEDAKLVVTFPLAGGLIQSKGNYWVLDTDYKSYSVVYSCQPLTILSHSTNAWILTRDREPSAEVILKAAKVFSANNVPLKDLKRTDQTGCTKKNSVSIKCELV